MNFIGLYRLWKDNAVMIQPPHHSVLLFLIAGALNLIMPHIAHAQTDRYLRFGLGAGESFDAVFFDRDCSSTSPAGLFGCGAGPDGLPRGGYGNFGSFAASEIAIGFRFSERTRAELGLSVTNDMNFRGQSNFTGIPVGQAPISTNGSSMAMMVHGYYELRDRGQGVRLVPYLTLGAGISHNRIDDMTYGFPSLGPTAATIVPGGSSTAIAVSAGFGVDVKISESMALDVGYRFWDRGDVATDAGDIRIIRDDTVDLLVPIGRTDTNLTFQHAYVGLRISF